MSTRTRLAAGAWAALLIAVLSLGARWPLMAAMISAAFLFGWFGMADYIANRTPTPPEPRCPDGVRIIHPDGTETPCELAYAGVHTGRWHEWAVTTLMGVGDELRVDDVHCPTVITTTVSDDVAGAAWGTDGYRMEGKQ